MESKLLTYIVNFVPGKAKNRGCISKFPGLYIRILGLRSTNAGFGYLIDFEGFFNGCCHTF